MRARRWYKSVFGSAISIGGSCIISACAIHPQPLAALSLSNEPFRHRDIASKITQRATPDVVPDQLAWIDLFGDPELSRLARRTLSANLKINAANARIAQSRALLGLARSSTLPTVRAGGTFNRNRVSGTVDEALPRRTSHNWALPIDATYDVDIWGRSKGGVDAGKDNLLAAYADADATRLRIVSELATDYLTLRYIDLDRLELVRSIALRQTALDLVQGRVKAGYASDLDALRATTELKTASAELAESDRLRDNLVDAIAVLVASSVTDIQVEMASGPVLLPSVPVGLPSQILANRPDIYAAQHRLEEASLRVGIAKAAFLPSLTLSATGGFASDSLRTFLDRNSSVWGLGLSIAETIFDGGKRQAGVDEAKAEYLIVEANYRQTVFEALRQVQDALNDISQDRLQSADYDAASVAASQAAALSRSRYERGYVNYFEVVDADRSALSVKRQLIRSDQAQAVATISLFLALGGGWRASDVTLAAGPVPPSR